MIVIGVVGVACLAAVRGFGRSVSCKTIEQGGIIASVGDSAPSNASPTDPCSDGPAAPAAADDDHAPAACEGKTCFISAESGGGDDDDARRAIEATEKAGYVVDVLPMFLPLPTPAKIVVGGGTKAFLVMIDRKKCDAAAACIEKLHKAIFDNKANEHVDLWKMSNPNCTNDHLKAGWAKWQDEVKSSPELKELAEQVEKDGVRGTVNKIQYTRYKCEHLKAVFSAVAKRLGGAQTAQGNPDCTQVQFPNLCELGAPKPVVPQDKLTRICGIGAPHAQLKHIAATGGSLCQYTCGAMAQGWGTWIQGNPPPKPVPKWETHRCEGKKCKSSERDLVTDFGGGLTNSADCAHCCVQK